MIIFSNILHLFYQYKKNFQTATSKGTKFLDKSGNPDFSFYICFSLLCCCFNKTHSMLVKFPFWLSIFHYCHYSLSFWDLRKFPASFFFHDHLAPLN